MDRSPDSRRTQLARRLRELRAASFPSGSDFARHLGWSQAQVSRYETGNKLPSSQGLSDWLAALDATDETRAEIQQLADEARSEYRSSKHAASRGRLYEMVEARGHLEARSKTISEYQPAQFPGLLQTPSYTRELLDGPGGAIALAGIKDLSLIHI